MIERQRGCRNDSNFPSVANSPTMKFPSIFINHGGGPLPLIGRQPELATHMKEIASHHLPPRQPKAIVVISAHYEADPVEITSSMNPSMLFDYNGFPPETYRYNYSAPGSPELAQKIKTLLNLKGVNSKFNEKRGFDHGVFVPLMLMYPEAMIPVVCVSLHASLDVSTNLKIGSALAPLQEEDVLILGSGYSFHNMGAFFSPTKETIQASIAFNEWIKTTLLTSINNRKNPAEQLLTDLKKWKTAPGALISHPREEHLLPLFMVAACAADAGCSAHLIYDTTFPKDDSRQIDKSLSAHAITGYLFS